MTRLPTLLVRSIATVHLLANAASPASRAQLIAVTVLYGGSILLDFNNGKGDKEDLYILQKREVEQIHRMLQHERFITIHKDGFDYEMAQLQEIVRVEAIEKVSHKTKLAWRQLCRSVPMELLRAQAARAQISSALLFQILQLLNLFIQYPQSVAEDWHKLGPLADLLRRPTSNSSEFGHGSDKETPPEIILEDVTLHDSNGEPIVRSVSASFQRGQFVCLRGPSGCGKSSILSLIALLRRPTHGTIYFDSQDSQQLDPMWFRSGLAMIDQDPSLVSGSVYDIVTYPKRAISQADIQQTLNRLGLAVDLQKPVEQLSGGEKQRVLLAHLLLVAKNSGLVLLDEPTSSQDPKSAAAICSIIKHDLRGKTRVVATHDEALSKEADVIVYIRDGEVETIRPI